MTKENGLEVQPWDRQPGETKARFDSFRQYRDMGPTRNLRKLSQIVGKSLTTLGKYSKDGDWVERSTAWDAHQDAVRRQHMEESAKMMGERQASIALAMQEMVVLRLKSMPIEALSAQDLANWMKIAVKIEREAYGQPGDIVEQRHNQATEIRNIINNVKLIHSDPDTIDAAFRAWEESVLGEGDIRGALESGEHGEGDSG